MRQILFGVLCAMLMVVPVMAEEHEIDMNNTTNQGHNEGVLPPEVTYDDEEETLTVELDLTAPAAYVEVTDDVTGATEAAAPLIGGENVVPMPTLDEGSYTVTVTLANGATYEGTLLIE